MPRYLFRGTGPEGEACHDRVDAVNLDQARHRLETRGYRDIEFYSDENADLIKRAIQADSNVPEADAADWTPEDEVESQRRKGVLAKLWWAVKQHAVFLAPLLVWNVVSLTRHSKLTVADWIGFGSAAAYLSVFFLLVAPMIVFNQLLEASVWVDWKAVKRWIAVGRFLRRIMRMGIPESELQIRSAYAEAGQGRLSEALKIMDVVHANPNLAECLYQARLAIVYEFAGDSASMIRCMEKAAETGSGGVTEWIDLANARLRRGRDVAGARRALEKVEGKEMPLLPRAAYERCLGLIACEEERFAEAVEHLNHAISTLTSLVGNPLIQVWIWETQAYLTIALGGLGRKAEAQEHFRQIAKWLEARKERELLARCRAALGRRC